MTKTTSFGMLILNEHDQLLLAHVTGGRHWDIPKGGADPGENALDTALRETREETGFAFAGAQLQDLGLHPYLGHKDLHLFRTRVTTRERDISVCVCTSYFTHRVSGKHTPEMDGFRWADASEVPDLCTPAMSGLLGRLLSDRQPA